MAEKMTDKKDRGQSETLKKVFRYLGKYRIFVVFSILLAAVSVALTLYIPKLTGYAVDHIVGPGQVDLPGAVQVMIQIGICTLVTSLAQWLMNVCNNKMTYQVVQDIRNEAFRKIEVLPLKYIDRHPYGEVVSRVIADVDQFADGLLMGFTQLFTGIATIIGTFGFMLSVNVRITFVVVLITPVSFFVANFIAKRTFAMFRRQSEIRGEQTGLIDEMIGNQKVVQAFGRGKKVTEEFDRVNEKLGIAYLKATFFSSITNPATRFVNSLVYTGVGITGAFAVVNGSLTVGQLSSFLSYANQYTKPFNEVTGVLTQLQTGIAAAARVFEVLEAEDEQPDPENPVTLENCRGNIKIDDVSFSYTKDKPLIQHFTLDVKSGNHVAIVGPTGCGKTTFINLLMRFYETDSGKITIDGVDIREMTRDDLRKQFGMVLQDSWLFSGTIMENLKYGNENATEEEVVKAAKAAYAHGFIRRMPNGYNTVISEGGGNLSRGQIQLLCIARAMLTNPAILILDEATSSIDTLTEIRVQKAFAHIMEGRTSFVVAHRLSTIKESDVILVMKDGNIIEQGSHDELLAKNGFYSVLYNSQFAKTS